MTYIYRFRIHLAVLVFLTAHSVSAEDRECLAYANASASICGVNPSATVSPPVAGGIAEISTQLATQYQLSATLFQNHFSECFQAASSCISVCQNEAEFENNQANVFQEKADLAYRSGDQAVANQLMDRQMEHVTNAANANRASSDCKVRDMERASLFQAQANAFSSGAAQANYNRSISSVGGN